MDITVTISTKGRYLTTLPLALMSITNQTLVPKKVIIFDDNENTLDLRESYIYKAIFNIFMYKGIEWEVIFGGKCGQVFNHRKALEIVNTDYIFRMDDDNILEPNVLSNLSKFIKEKKVAAVSCSILNPEWGKRKKHPLASNKIEDIFLGLNEQWYEINKVKKVDHLYSCFLFKKEAAKPHYYDKGLSKIGHREETIFTYQMVREGWDLLIIPYTYIWHLHAPVGGIRTGKVEMWDQDEKLFHNKLKEWNITPIQYKLIVLEGGLGDHLAFLNVLPEIKKKYSNILIANCYPQVFEDEKDIKLISIEDARQMCDIQNYNVYKYLWDHSDEKITLVEAYRRLYA